MQVVCLSDTHGHHGTLRLPPGDVLLHAGDFTHGGTVAEARAFLAWFSRAGTFTHRILIAGNHDLVFDRDAALARTCCHRTTHRTAHREAETAKAHRG